MKITDNRLKTDTIFGMLDNGDVFLSPADDEYYMVTNSVLTETNEYNAVCLSNGIVDTFYADDRVKQVHAELIIS